MNPLGATRFAVRATALALACGAGVALVASPAGPTSLRWSLWGWLVTAATGVVGGGWLVSRHGRPGSAFLVALATCMLSRLLVGGAGAAAAAFRGTEAMIAFVCGLAAGYIPVQILEMVWFQRRVARGTDVGPL